MGDRTGIEWADATWNPIVGCSLKSPGCTRCYAMRMAARIEAMQPGSHYARTTVSPETGPVWTGNLALAPTHILTQPQRWRRPRTIFVNSMGDLFHEAAPERWIDLSFAIMAMCPHHTLLVLTKRPDEMARYFEDRTARYSAIHDAIFGEELSTTRLDPRVSNDARIENIDHLYKTGTLLNVFLGVSVEDQRRADERRPAMAALAAQGWRTFVSYEPALGMVDWRGWEFLSGLISGGESGPRARPSHPSWHRAARDFCAERTIPYFFKQWGEWVSIYDRDRDDPDWRNVPRPGDWDRKRFLNLAGGQGFHGEALNMMRRVGKAKAGRLLDGIEHNALPWGTA